MLELSRKGRNAASLLVCLYTLPLR